MIKGNIYLIIENTYADDDPEILGYVLSENKAKEMVATGGNITLGDYHTQETINSCSRLRYKKVKYIGD